MMLYAFWNILCSERSVHCHTTDSIGLHFLDDTHSPIIENRWCFLLSFYQPRTSIDTLFSARDVKRSFLKFVYELMSWMLVLEKNARPILWCKRALLVCACLHLFALVCAYLRPNCAPLSRMNHQKLFRRVSQQNNARETKKCYEFKITLECPKST